MDRFAVFVDAGYLFAQGSAALNGKKVPRADLVLNDAAIITELTTAASGRCGSLPLLRIYWYDGADSRRGPTAEHARLAHTDHVKVRLGFVNSVGQQKGVDSLIVTDLVELARTGAICEAVLVSGDEDVRIGVQIAQSLGVRVHLIGIAPCRGSQSLQLMQEADTTTEWDRATVARFLSVRPEATARLAGKAAAASPKSPNTAKAAAGAPAGASIAASGRLAVIATVVTQYFGTLDPADVAGAATLVSESNSIPREFDGKLLAKCRDAIGCDLDPADKRHARAQFRSLVKGGAPTST